MSRYTIETLASETNDASTKPKTDIDKILQKQLGFNIVYVKEINYGPFNRHLFIKSRIKHAFRGISLNSNDIVLNNYPNYIGDKFQIELINYLNKYNVKKIALIHDLDSLRMDKSILGSLNDEIKYLNNYDIVISQNEKMTSILKEKGLKTKIVNIGLFDYLAPNNSTKNNSEFKDNITFAGNLNKAPFLEHLTVKRPLHFDLYGIINDESKINSTLDYHGSVTPTELSKLMGKGFGLVWDGPSVNEVSGSIGNYLKYNNPYKVSSYIDAGMPVIVWDKSASSDFVNKHNIGISVNSISDLNKITRNISDEQFNDMCKNVKEMKNKINHGYFTRRSVENAINKLN